MNALIDALNRAAEGFCHHGFWMLVQTGILVAILWGLDRILRKRVRAGVRYCIWLLVLLKLLMPADLRLPSGVGYWLSVEPLPVAHVQPDRAPHVQESTVTPVQPASETPVPSTSNISGEMRANAFSSPEPTQRTVGPALTWKGWLLLAWLIGAGTMGLMLAWQFLSLRGIIRRSSTAPEFLDKMLNALQNSLVRKDAVQVRQSDEVGSPAVCGLLRPVILMPKHLVGRLSHEQLETVVLHELMHIQRYDLWVNLLQTVLQIFYFYNPFVRLANSRIRKTREQANDEQVLFHLRGRRDHYSAALIEVAAAGIGRPKPAMRLIGVAEPKSHLHERIILMTQKPVPKTIALGVPGILTLLVLGLVLLPMAGRTRAQAAEAAMARQAAANLTPEAFLAEASQAMDTLVKGNQTADAAMAASVFTPDAVILPKGADAAIGKAAIAGLYNAAITKGERVLTANTVFEEVWTSGRYVFSIDRSGLTVRVPQLQHLLLVNSHTLYVWEVQPDGSLKVKADAWTFAPTPSGDDLLSGSGVSMQPDAFHAASGSPSVEASQATLDAVKQLSREFHQQCLKADAALTASWYADNAVCISDQLPLMRGRDQIRANIEAFNRQFQLEAIGDRIVFAEGTEDMVYVVNRFEWKLRDITQGTDFGTYPGKGMHVWQKQPDGNWKILIDVNNTNIL